MKEKAHQDELEMTCQFQIAGLNDFVFLNRFGSVQNPQAVNRAIARITRDYNEHELDLAEKEKREGFYNLLETSKDANLEFPQ